MLPSVLVVAQEAGGGPPERCGALGSVGLQQVLVAQLALGEGGGAGALEVARVGSGSEFDPRRFAPCTDTQAASPTVLRPGATVSGLSAAPLTTSPW